MDLPKDIKGVTVIGLGPRRQAASSSPSRARSTRPASSPWSRPTRTTRRRPTAPTRSTRAGSDEYGAFINDDLLVFSEGRAVAREGPGHGRRQGQDLRRHPAQRGAQGGPGRRLPQRRPARPVRGLGKELGQSKVLDKASGLFFLAQEKTGNLHAPAPGDGGHRRRAPRTWPTSSRASSPWAGSAGTRATWPRSPPLARRAPGQAGRQGPCGIDFERPSKEIADAPVRAARDSTSTETGRRAMTG
ncbi:MAG: hypothetical protein MZU79_04585 [Anaerotruncus sp.]|nr:hypothetical protein [Anaerotruncus sp.]